MQCHFFWMVWFVLDSIQQVAWGFSGFESAWCVWDYVFFSFHPRILCESYMILHISSMIWWPYLHHFMDGRNEKTRNSGRTLRAGQNSQFPLVKKIPWDIPQVTCLMVTHRFIETSLNPVVEYSITAYTYIIGYIQYNIQSEIHGYSQLQTLGTSKWRGNSKGCRTTVLMIIALQFNSWVVHHHDINHMSSYSYVILCFSFNHNTCSFNT